MATPPVGASSRDNTQPCFTAFDYSWGSLNDRERGAAEGLGWKPDGSDWREGPTADKWNSYLTMDGMKEKDKNHWRILGFDEERWKAWTEELSKKPKRRRRGGAKHSTPGESSASRAGLGDEKATSAWPPAVSYTHLTLPTKRIV